MTEEQKNAVTLHEGKVKLVCGKSVDGQEFEEVSLASKVQTLARKTKSVISYREAKKEGFQAAFLAENRDVNYFHIEELWKNAKERQVFDQDCLVVALRSVLHTYPSLQVLDLSGNHITIDSPDLEYYLLVLDGQHRITACELHPELDALLEVNDFDGRYPLDVIKSMNSLSRNWGNKDFRHSIVAAGSTTNRLYEESKKLQDQYDLTAKCADYILTFVPEATRKSNLIVGKDTTILVPEHAKRGLGIFNAVMMNFQEAKELKKVQFIAAIVNTYNQIPDKNKATFGRNMKLLLATLAGPEQERIKTLIKDTNYGELKDVINEYYVNFCDSHSTEDLEAMEGLMDEEIEQFVETLAAKRQEEKKGRQLKEGRIHEIIQSNALMKAKSEKEQLARAEQKLREAEQRYSDVEVEKQVAETFLRTLEGTDSKSSKEIATAKKKLLKVEGKLATAKEKLHEARIAFESLNAKVSFTDTPREV